MANYKNIKGFHVQSQSTDPATSSMSAGSWASGGTMNTARKINSGSAGSQSAALVFGGGGPPWNAETESYNGTAWTEKGDLNQGRRSLAGMGTNTAALGAGGYNGATRNTVESFNGTGWTELTENNTAREEAGGAGTQTAGLIFGGNPALNVTESWNGSSWTEVNELNTGRNALGGTGQTNTAAMCVTGQTPSPPVTSLTEIWNGTSWTEVAETNIARNYATGVSGSSTEAVIAGGSSAAPAVLANAEYYDGTSWTEINDLSTARNQSGGLKVGGTAALSMVSGGDPGPAVTGATEEFTSVDTPYVNEGQVYFNSSSTNAFKVTQYSVPAGTWATGASFPSTVVESGGIGSSASDGLVIDDASGAPNAFKYDGSSWATAGSMATWRKGRMLGAGSSTAGLMAAGVTASPFPANKSVLTEKYDGSSWTEVGDLNTASYNNSAGRCGTSTSAIRAGGTTAPSPDSSNFSDINESWNGTAWSEEAELNTGRRSQAGTGASNTESFIIGGGVPPNNASALCEKWDGTSWTETGDMNTARYQNCAAGSTGSAITYGGNLYPSSPPYSALCESFNGSTWSEVADLATGRQYLQGGGSSASGAIGVGGYGPPGSTTAETEEWTAPLANKTITVS
tara:strand:+ start:153 stop:2033 length:1881 start_codon:yes stop_codon:yes gene_type:complete